MDDVTNITTIKHLGDSMESFPSARKNTTSTSTTKARQAPTKFGSRYGYLVETKRVGWPLHVILFQDTHENSVKYLCDSCGSAWCRRELSRRATRSRRRDHLDIYPEIHIYLGFHKTRLALRTTRRCMRCTRPSTTAGDAVYAAGAWPARRLATA